jgi:hypothetical protein
MLGPQGFSSPQAFRQSLEERLRQRAAARGLDVNGLRLKLLMERLLARLFDDQDPPWLLKGGYAMELRFRPRARTTRVLDLAMPPMGSSFELALGLVREALQQAAARPAGDFLVFRVGDPTRLIEAAPEGGARFPVVVSLAGREYGRFHVDVGIGPLVGEPELLRGDDLLAFAGVPAALARAVPRELQFAEKVHAYSRPWGDRINTRTKDLVDLLLLVDAGLPDIPALREALRVTFAQRPRQSLPEELPPPPVEWREDFAVMAEELQLPVRDLDAGFAVLTQFWRQRALGTPERGR